MNIKRLISTYLLILGLSQVVHAQEWYELSLKDIGTIEIPGKPLVYDTLGIRYFKVRTDTLSCVILIGSQVQGENARISSKERLMRGLEVHLTAEKAQLLQKSDTIIDGRNALDCRHLVTYKSGSDQSIITNIRYLRLVDNDGRTVSMEIGGPVKYDKHVQPIKDRFFNSLKLNEASVNPPVKPEVVTREVGVREKIHTTGNVLGKIAVIVFLIIGALLLVNRLKK